MKKINYLLLSFLFCVSLGSNPSFSQTAASYDIVIYGGTSGGIAAAIQSSRMDKSVLLIEPTERIGGLTTGGLGQTDIGNKAAIGGISREFYQHIRKYYEDPSNWKWQQREEYQDGGQTRTAEGEDAMWTFEPSAALQVYQDMLAAENVELVYGERLDREDGVTKEGTTITAIVERVGLSNVQVTVSAQNLLTFTKYQGLDPEFNNSSIYERGFDDFSFPNLKMYTLGLQLGF